MAAYYCCLAYYALGPDRLASWAAPRLQHARGAAVRAGAAAADATVRAGTAAADATVRAGSAAATWAKGINWKRWRDPESLLEVHF